MKNVIEEMLDGYGKGQISRWEFVQPFAVIAASPKLRPGVNP